MLLIIKLALTFIFVHLTKSECSQNKNVSIICSICLVICYDSVSPLPCLGIKAFPLGHPLLGHLFLGSILNHSMCSRDEEYFSMFSNCNAKWCVCCTHLCTKRTITSSVFSRQFSIINNYDLNLTSSDLVYFLLMWHAICLAVWWILRD